MKGFIVFFSKKIIHTNGLAMSVYVYGAKFGTISFHHLAFVLHHNTPIAYRFLCVSKMKIRQYELSPVCSEFDGTELIAPVEHMSDMYVTAISGCGVS